MSVRVDGTTGMLSEVTVNRKVHYVQQEFLWYPGYSGDNESAERRSSGAYIFRPNGTDAFPIRQTTAAAIVSAVYTGMQFKFTVPYKIINSRLATGPLVQEIHQFYDSWVSQVIRIYKGQEHVEFDWVIGPIPVK